jgi:hypothetical protein
MSPRTCTTPALVSAIALALGIFAGCGAPPKPPPPPPAEPTTKWEEGGEKKPAAPKKCEALDEKCKAASTTKARIAKAGYTIVPVSGWFYAQGENATIAQKDDTGAAMTVAGYDVPTPKDEAKNRDAALEAAAKEVGVTLPKKKVNWKKADDTKDVSGVKINLWEADGASRKDKKGALLIFSASLPENKGIVGFGFVPDDAADAEKIVEGLQTSITSVEIQK